MTLSKEDQKQLAKDIKAARKMLKEFEDQFGMLTPVSKLLKKAKRKR